MRLLDERTLGFADYRGNEQYITLGNVSGDDRVAEGGFVLHVEGLDWSCPRHITPRYTEEELRQRLTPLMSDLEALRAENARRRAAAVDNRT